MKKLTIVATLVLLISVMAGCSTPARDTDSADPVISQEKREQGDKVYKIGETVKVKDFEIKIASVSFTEADPYMPPEHGKVLAIQFNAYNNSDQQIYIGREEFNLYDAEGKRLESYFSSEELFMNARLHKGKETSGILYFDVAGEDRYELVYNPSFILDGKEVRFEIIPQNKEA